MTHICVNKLTIIGSDNGLSPGRRQAIIWTNAGILLIGSLGTKFSEILIEIHTFLFKKIHLNMSSAKWRPFCLGLNELKSSFFYCRDHECGPDINVYIGYHNIILADRHFPMKYLYTTPSMSHAEITESLWDQKKVLNSIHIIQFLLNRKRYNLLVSISQGYKDWKQSHHITIRLKQTGHNSAVETFRCTCLNGKCCILIQI